MKPGQTKAYITGGAARIGLLGCALLVLASDALAQDATSVVRTLPLTVRSGVPLRLIMTEKLRFKLNEPVHARVTEPVYVFDREVIPPGAEATGRIVGFHRPSRWVRAWAIMSGNLTPLREPDIEFNSLSMKDGTNLSIATDVTPGTDTVVRFTDAQAAAKGRIASMKDIARQQIESRKRAVIDAVKGPGKLARIKDALWSMLPYHPQSLPAGSRFTATFRSPLDFGMATLDASELDDAGSQPPSSDVVNALLATALDSRTTPHGMEVEATLSRPLFSADNHLIFPEGSRLVGTVVQTRAARHWHRSGKLAFMFTGIEAPASDLLGTPPLHQVEGRLAGVEVDGKSGEVRLDEEGGVSVADSKKRFIAPAVASLLAIRSTEGKDVEPDNDADDVGMRPGQIGGGGNNFGPRILAGGIGFGLVGAALGRLSQPVSSVLGFYGAGRLAYSNIIGRGQEITFPKNTPLEVRFSPSVVPQSRPDR
jgi:hypothetical protein